MAPWLKAHFAIFHPSTCFFLQPLLQLARVAALEMARSAEGEALAEARQAVGQAQRRELETEQALADADRRAAELMQQLTAKRQECKDMRSQQDAAAAFLVQCIADLRGSILAQGQQALTQATGSTTTAGDAAASPGLHEQPLAQREALLQALLGRLGVEWQEGLVLPASSSSTAFGGTGPIASACCSFGELSMQSLASVEAGGDGGTTATCPTALSNPELTNTLRSEVRPLGLTSAPALRDLCFLGSGTSASDGSFGGCGRGQSCSTPRLGQKWADSCREREACQEHKPIFKKGSA